MCLQNRKSTPQAATSTHLELFSRVGRRYSAYTSTGPRSLSPRSCRDTQPPPPTSHGHGKVHESTLPHRLSVVTDLVHLESRPCAQITHHLVHNTTPLDVQPACGSLAPTLTSHRNSLYVQGPHTLFAHPTYQCCQFWEPAAEGNVPLPGSCPHTERPALSSAPAYPLSRSHTAIQAHGHRCPHAPDL